MKHKLKKIVTNFRVIVLLILLALALVAIHPGSQEGVAIRNVVQNSSAALAGIESPEPNSAPMSREVITAVNSQPINDLKSYHDIVDSLLPNVTVTIQTNRAVYRVVTKPEYEVTVLPELINKTVTRSYVSNDTNETEYYNETISVNKTIKEIIGTKDIGMSVYDAPSTNIRKGLDLEGGTRVLLKPTEKLSDDTMAILIDNMKQRLNIYGLSDISIRTAGDLFSDTQYIVVEIAGANEEDVKDLLAKQGKFEAKIANDTVFNGGAGDITYVCRSSDCSGIDPFHGCGQVADGYSCRFRFSISLKPVAAQRQADLTGQLDTITTDEQGNYIAKDNQYLSEKLRLYLDDQLVDELSIGASLKGRTTTDIQISGSGAGQTEQQAAYNALENMKKLQTILVTGSLPAELEIVKMESLSPELGHDFINNSLFIGILAILSVAIVVYIRYRKAQIFLPMVLTMTSEVVLLLGLAGLIGWNIDLAAIAGIIIAVGTGVDDQIVITDEVLRGESTRYINWKTKFKNAFFIIMASFFTTFVALIPLYFAGAGMLKGFAITTIIGITFGVFITRPAFAAIVEVLLQE